MRRALLTAAIVAASLLPVSAFAMTTQTFEFAEGQVNAQWEGKGALQMEKAPSGILLTSTSTGTFLTKTPLSIFPEEGSVTASTEQDANLYLVWIYDDDPLGIAYNMPIALPAGAVTTVSVSLADHLHWSPAPKKIGLALPAGTTILLHRIEFTQWNILERAIEMMKSFWNFDVYAPYAINFIWGPQMADHPLATSQMYDSLPPRTLSACWVLNLLLGIVIACCAIFLYYMRPSATMRRRILLTVAALILGVWILLDIRMGSEFLGWVMHDDQTYISAPAGLRTFRDRQRFYDFADFAVPLVFDRSGYLFFTDREWPYLGNMRYLTYPAIPGNAIERDDTLVVFHRPDLAVDSENRITMNGEPVTAPGTILGRFDDSSFIFRLPRQSAPAPNPAPPITP